MPTTTVPPPISTHLPERFGFKAGAKGAHTSRTMMLAELTDLLRAHPEQTTTPDQFRTSINIDNILGKRTLATRKLTFQRLSELYGLDPALPIFRVLRRLWESDRAGRPMLALLVAYARDPLLRATVRPVLMLSVGKIATTAMLDEELAGRLGTRLNPSVRKDVAMRTASTWTQSGHLTGRAKKARSSPKVTPAVVALAVLLAAISGSHGRSAFTSEYVNLLDCPSSRLSPLLQQAHRAGFINFKQAGDIVEIRFPELLTQDEEAMIHGI